MSGESNNKMFDIIIDKIEKLDDKIEKLREKVVNPNTMKIAITLFIGVLSWLSLTLISINNTISEHDVKLNTIQNQLNPIVNSFYNLNKKSQYTNQETLKVVKK